MNSLYTLLPLLPFWEQLTAEEKSYLSKSCAKQSYAKGSFIHSGAEGCLGVITLLSGSIRVYILSEEGREITLFYLKPGETCVLAAACVIREITFDTMMEADQDSELLVIQSGAFDWLAESNVHVRCFMYEQATRRFSDVMWTMQQILFKGFDRRLAAFLIDEYRSSGRAEINMTHELIAQRTNSAREVVARMLKRFAADHLVEFKRGCIRLIDIPALEDLV